LSAQSQLFTSTEDAVTIARLRKNMLILLQNVGWRSRPNRSDDQVTPKLRWVRTP
jgi:hypothetical protein